MGEGKYLKQITCSSASESENQGMGSKTLPMGYQPSELKPTQQWACVWTMNCSQCVRVQPLLYSYSFLHFPHWTVCKLSHSIASLVFLKRRPRSLGKLLRRRRWGTCAQVTKEVRIHQVSNSDFRASHGLVSWSLKEEGLAPLHGWKTISRNWITKSWKPAGI